MTGQNRKDPFHVNRDVVRDNLTVVRKLRLPKGAQIRARKMYATAALAGSPAEASVTMPYTGNLYLSVSGAPGVVTINNPFITGASFSPVQIINFPAGGAASTISASGAGQAELDVVVDGTYVINVGSPTNPKATNYSY